MAKFARTWLGRALAVAAIAAGCGSDPAPTSTTTAPGGSAIAAPPAGDAMTTPTSPDAPRAFADELRGLLDLAAQQWPVTSEHVLAYLRPRAVAITQSDAQLRIPAWARSVGRAEDTFVTLGGDIAGAALPVDDRGHGPYVHLYVPGGTRAGVEAILGPLHPAPLMPGGPATALAYPVVAGHRLRVIVEEQRGQSLVVKVHFEQ